MAGREALRGKKHPADKRDAAQLLEASPSQRDDEKERRGHVENRHGHDPPDSKRRLLGKHDQGCRPRPRDRGEAHEAEKQPARVALENKRNYNQGRHGCDAADCIASDTRKMGGKRRRWAWIQSCSALRAAPPACRSSSKVAPPGHPMVDG